MDLTFQILTINLKIKTTVADRISVFFAGLILILWGSLLGFNLFFSVQFWFFELLLVFLQAYLFTGLFIVAHDAMHGNVHSNSKINNAIGQFCLWLYAAFSFEFLLKKHRLHHSNVGTKDDPDFRPHHFLKWYLGFMWPYFSWRQLFIMAAVFNFFHWIIGVPQSKLVLFWIIPSFISTLQLFYFGTYLPHRNAEKIDNRHKSRSIHKNHLWALLSCYFFGYHYQHHLLPRVPWWRLWTKV